MDPITRAMAQLARDAESFWRAQPNRLLPIVASPDQRGDVVSALRLRERSPDNRRPLVVVGAPFTSARAYFAAASTAVARAYELVRAGVAEEGVVLPPFAGNEATRPSRALETAVLVMDRAARLLVGPFDGLVVALVPEHVADEAGFRASLCVLSAARLPPRVRVAVLLPPGGRLSDDLRIEGVRFALDTGALLAFLNERTRRDPEHAPVLPTLLLCAAEALSAGRPIEAAALYRQARIECQVGGLVEQEAAVLMALGGACLAAEVPDLGLSSYQEAAALAEGAEAWTLACQAWLGAGSIFLRRGDSTAAAVAYRTAATAAERAALVPLGAEALRLAQACMQHAS